MNKKRLLLFSVFALLHITISDCKFIDGRRCNHSSRSLLSDNIFSTYETHRVERFLPEIRQLNDPQKYLKTNERDTETTQLSKRQQVGYIKHDFRDSEIREIVERHRKIILTNRSINIHGRPYLKERIRERSNASRNDFRRNRFATFRDRKYQRNFQIPSWFSNDDRINDATNNRLQKRNVNRHKFIYRDAHIHNTRDNRNEVKHNLPDLVKRNTQRYTNRNNMINDFDYVKCTETGKRSDKINVVNTLANDRNSRLGRYQNLDEDLSQNELSLKNFITNNVRSVDRMNLINNRKRSISDNQIIRRSVRDTDHLNPLIDRRARSENVRNMARSELRTGIRNSKLELREKSRLQRECAKKRHERETRTQSDRRQSLDRIDKSEEMKNRLNIRSRSFEDDASRDRRNDARVQFAKRSVDDNMRYNRGSNEREISKERLGRINIRPDRSRVYMNSRQFTERNTLESRLSKKIRQYEGADNRDIKENRLNVRRSHIERALERDNKRTTRRNLSIEEFRVRDALSRSERVQRNTNDASERIGRRNREALSYSPEIRERDDSRRNLRESRYDRFIENRGIGERGDRHRSDNRHETINDRIRNNNIGRNFEKQFILPVRPDQSRITSNTHRNVMTVRSGIQIARSNIQDELRQRSRSLSNDKQSTGSREDTRKTNDERRQIKKTQERPINMRRMATVINERRESRMEFPDSKRSLMTNNIQYGNHVFEMKWQYLFYALQLVYLCGMFMNIPKDDDGNKHKRFADWFTPAKYLKID